MIYCNKQLGPIKLSILFQKQCHMERITMLNSLIVLIIVCGVLSLIFFIATIGALRRKKILSSALRILLAALFLTLAALFGTITIATVGYRALTFEETAATVTIEPLGAKSFSAHFIFPDGRQASYKLAGDELYVDAHILKWKNFVNILGLHTAYELDRVTGRYIDVKDELVSPRTVFLLSQDKPLNMFNLRQRYFFLWRLLDAEYGSATFINSDKTASFEIRVSTTGLLIRDSQPQ
jgi:hypothetical protein